jgi:UDP-glucose:(heptosyl)LPS alpha-1,3-glucosyltransferase
LERAAIREEFGVKADDILVLEVAHNFRLKGVNHWLQTVKRLHEQGHANIRSLVIGRGDTPRWHHRAKKMGLDGALEFLGPSERVRQFYHAADMLVHPTYYDPCSRVVLEAMASGLSCITTRWDGASEIIADGVSGYVLGEPGDVQGLGQKVLELCDPKRRRPMGVAAREAVRPFSMARHAEEMLKLYEELSRSRKVSA